MADASKNTQEVENQDSRYYSNRSKRTTGTERGTTGSTFNF